MIASYFSKFTWLKRISAFWWIIILLLLMVKAGIASKVTPLKQSEKEESELLLWEHWIGIQKLEDLNYHFKEFASDVSFEFAEKNEDIAKPYNSIDTSYKWQLLLNHMNECYGMHPISQHRNAGDFPDSLSYVLGELSAFDKVVSLRNSLNEDKQHSYHRIKGIIHGIYSDENTIQVNIETFFQTMYDKGISFNFYLGDTVIHHTPFRWERPVPGIRAVIINEFAKDSTVINYD